MIPLAFGTDSQFAAVREALDQAEYSESTVCRLLGLQALSDLSSAFHKRTHTALDSSDRASLLVRLFLCGAYVEREQARAGFRTAFEALEALELVTADARRPGLCYSPVLLYPTRGLYLVSDRVLHPDGTPVDDAADLVYLAISEKPQFFVETAPQEPCERLLDLGTGSGIGALLASRYAQHVSASDLTERAAHFAEFNRRLNGISNVAVRCGDLYEPWAGQTFDRIIAHAPYDLSLQPQFIFCDGGDDGEQFTRRIVEGLPGHLEPGGRFYCLTMGSDRRSEPLEQRVRRWLGDAEKEFDVAVFVKEVYPPNYYALEAVSSTGKLDQMPRWMELFDNLGVEELLYGFLVLVRRDGARPVFTLRRHYGPHSRPEHLEWLLKTEIALSDPAQAGRLLETRPIVSPNLELQVRHRWRESSLVPTGYLLQTDYPFHTQLECHPWVAFLVSRCDGRRTGRELYDVMGQQGVPLDRFVQALRALVSGGFVEVAAGVTAAPPAAE